MGAVTVKLVLFTGEFMKVWRVQNREGEGPYSAEWPGSLTMANAHSNDPLHPAPEKDFGICTLSGIDMFGFATRKAGENWFGAWMSKLNANGFFLVKLKASKVVYRGAKQLVFVKA